MRRALLSRFVPSLAFAAATAAHASFHLMQIEHVMGGVYGFTDEQAIQLRLRSAGQNFVSQGRLNVRDATGANPVLLLNIPGDVGDGSGGARVLLTTADFAATHAATPDFTLTNRIPASYLAAGRLTFEDDFGTIYWSLSWGGAGYTGSNSGNITNDADGNFGPPFAGSLVSATSVAILFPGAAGAMSTRPARLAAIARSPRASSRAISSASHPPMDEPTATCGPRQKASNTAKLSSSQRPMVPSVKLPPDSP